jgi:hypothetical protein
MAGQALPGRRSVDAPDLEDWEWPEHGGSYLHTEVFTGWYDALARLRPAFCWGWHLPQSGPSRPVAGQVEIGRKWKGGSRAGNVGYLPFVVQSKSA